MNNHNGTRRGTTVSWGIWNIRSPMLSPNEPPWITDIATPETSGQWTQRDSSSSFVYRDGSTNPPMPLREEPPQNYLSPGLRIVGLLLMSIAILSAVLSTAFVILRREHRVIKSSQPPLLLLVIFGTLIESLSILLISNDESFGWNKEALSRACMSFPW